LLLQHLAAVAPPSPEAGGPPLLVLSAAPGRCECRLRFRDQEWVFVDPNASEAYAAALLRVLRTG
jgi:hypothetical protein